MTKEQEAIEKLTNGEKIDFNTLIRKFKKEGIENFVVTKKEYIETVLSMLKEKDAKIEHLEEKRNNQKAELAILNEKQKEMNKLTNTVSSYKGMFKKEQKDNKKKDKIIDLMVEHINYLSDELVQATGRNELEFCNGNKCCIDSNYSCEQCIKQYFKQKATNNG